MFLSSISDISW